MSFLFCEIISLLQLPAKNIGVSGPSLKAPGETPPPVLVRGIGHTALLSLRRQVVAVGSRIPAAARRVRPTVQPHQITNVGRAGGSTPNR